MNNKTTICAIATAQGHGAIAVIRLSGPNAIAITEKIFVSPGKKMLSNQKANTIHFGSIVNNNEIIDDVLVSIFINPISYTGEDVIEISCHGSVYIQQQILQLLITSGAVLAKPGEFTLRAFLNGKMDLSQAEGVADLICSENKTSHDMAIQMLRGGFSSKINTIRTNLLNFCSLIELELDFSEEDVEFADRTLLKKNVTEILEHIEQLVKSFSLGNVLKNGVPVAIVGQPNVGKSTLLNTLLQDEKAIVSDIAGTTRDTIEDVITIEGIQFRFIDTAGIRHTTDTIESMGIERTFAKIEKARIILLLVESNQTIASIKTQIERIKPSEEQHLIVVVNKIDLYQGTSIESDFGNDCFMPHPTLFLSAKKHINTQALTDALLHTIRIQNTSHSDVIVSNVRHFESLTHALEAAHRVHNGLNSGLASDFIAQDIREILYYLGDIVGEVSTDEILGNIFGKFCIGK